MTQLFTWFKAYLSFSLYRLSNLKKLMTIKMELRLRIRLQRRQLLIGENEDHLCRRSSGGLLTSGERRTRMGQEEHTKIK